MLLPEISRHAVTQFKKLKQYFVQDQMLCTQLMHSTYNLAFRDVSSHIAAVASVDEVVGDLLVIG